jgi:ribosomal protein S18 acetylase RimI-like enzyme
MISYRHATPADVPALHGLLQALADHDDAGSVGSAESLRRHGFGPRPLFRAVLAERGADAVGMILFYPDYSTHRGEPGVYVQDFYVLPEVRGQGVGRRLLAAAMAAQDWGATYLTLGVDPQNGAARRIYQGLGFRPRGYDFLMLDGAALAALGDI